MCVLPTSKRTEGPDNRPFGSMIQYGNEVQCSARYVGPKILQECSRKGRIKLAIEDVCKEVNPSADHTNTGDREREN